MNKKANPKEKAPKTCRECSRWNEIKEKIRVAELLAKTIEGIEERLKDKTFKPTMGDYLKLLQMEQEIEQETPKEIKVTWVEPSVTSDSEK
jgi:lipoate-protein ligase A